MAKISWRVMVASAACALLAACGQRQANDEAASAGTQQAQAAPTVFEAMNQALVPASNKVWELAGNLWNDDGNLDASQLSAEQWQELREAAQAMETAATTLASAQPIVVAAPGVKILNEGASGALGAAEVQAAIDANPQTFQQDATALAEASRELIAAAEAKDATKTDELSNRLTELCGGCHQRFWTPEQAQ